jgi:hypothetical protein
MSGDANDCKGRTFEEVIEENVAMNKLLKAYKRRFKVLKQLCDEAAQVSADSTKRRRVAKEAAIEDGKAEADILSRKANCTGRTGQARSGRPGQSYQQGRLIGSSALREQEEQREGQEDLSLKSAGRPP